MKSKLAIASFIIALVLLILTPIIYFSISLLNKIGGDGLSAVIILSFFLIILPLGSLITLILSISSIIIIKKRNLEGNKYAIFGLLISIILIIIDLLLIFGSSKGFYM